MRTRDLPGGYTVFYPNPTPVGVPGTSFRGLWRDGARRQLTFLEDRSGTPGRYEEGDPTEGVWAGQAAPEMGPSGLGTLTFEDADNGLPFRVVGRCSQAIKGAGAAAKRTEGLGGPAQRPSRGLRLGPHPALPYALCNSGQVISTLSACFLGLSWQRLSERT